MIKLEDTILYGIVLCHETGPFHSKTSGINEVIYSTVLFIVYENHFKQYKVDTSLYVLNKKQVIYIWISHYIAYSIKMIYCSSSSQKLDTYSLNNKFYLYVRLVWVVDSPKVYFYLNWKFQYCNYIKLSVTSDNCVCNVTEMSGVSK